MIPTSNKKSRRKIKSSNLLESIQNTDESKSPYFIILAQDLIDNNDNNTDKYDKKVSPLSGHEPNMNLIDGIQE